MTRRGRSEAVDDGRAFVDALREFLGLDPLYTRDSKGDGRTVAERFYRTPPRRYSSQTPRRGAEGVAA